MRFIAEENIPAAAVAALTAAGHDVVWIRTAAPGVSDAEVLARAAREHRILITFDKDFGELSLRTALPRDSGVILLRIGMPTIDRLGPQIADIISARQDWPGHFSARRSSEIHSGHNSNSSFVGQMRHLAAFVFPVTQSKSA